MLLHIKNVLSPSQIQHIQKRLAQGEFVDGKLSAGKEAAEVKNNQELNANSPLQQELNSLVLGALLRHPQYQAAALPLKVATAFYARYTKGMTYGFHVDDPIMGPMAGRYRSDVSTTVFLNDADAYEGGEMMMQTPLGEQRIKGNVGDAVVYPSSTWHKVDEVTQGERLVAVTWAQSMVREPAKRELLYQLALAREGVMEKLPQSEEAANVSTAYANLLRMWSDV